MGARLSLRFICEAVGLIQPGISTGGNGSNSCRVPTPLRNVGSTSIGQRPLMVRLMLEHAC